MTKESDLGSILAAMDTPVATSAAEEPVAKEDKTDKKTDTKTDTPFRGGKLLNDQGGDKPKA